MAELKEITCSRDLDEVLNESVLRKILLFKHSTTCPISGRAWQELQNFIQDSSDKVLVAMIKVIESRPVSNIVTEVLEIKHQSPQIMLIFNRKVIWHASHQEVNQNNIKKAMMGEIRT